MIRRFRLFPCLAVVLLASCGSPGPSPQERERLAEQQRLLSLCQREQQRLPGLLKRFEAAQQALAVIRDQSYVPSTPPPPLDAEEQRRLTIYDQQMEQDLHEQAVDAWQRRDAERRDRWESEQLVRERAAAEALKGSAAALRQLHPELLLAGSPPQLNSEELERFRACEPERFR